MSVLPSPSRPSPSPRSVAVTLAVYHVLLGLCPRSFRDAYGADVVQVFRQCCGDAYRERGASGVACLWLPAIGDLLMGAAAEYCTLALEAWRRSIQMDRSRSSLITVFCAYIAFVVAGMSFQKVSEYEDFTAAAQAHTIIGVSFDVIAFGSAIALLAVLAGGLPLAFASLRYALSARRIDIPLLFGVPLVAFAALIGYGALALSLTRAERSYITSPGVGVGIGLVGVFIIGAIASTAAVSLAVKRSTIDGNLLRFTRIPAAITTLAMAAMCLATIIWGLSLRSIVPDLFNGNGGLLATNTAINWLSIVAVMTIATLVAIAGIFRGFNASQQARNATA